MRRLIAALAAAGLLISACDHQAASPYPPRWEQPAPKVTFPPVPGGLIASAATDGHSELRVYSASDGHLLRKFALPQYVGRLAFSSDLGYVAAQQPGTIHFLVRSGAAFRPVQEWDVAMLDMPDLPHARLIAGGFLAGTDRYVVQVEVNDDAEAPRYRTFSFDPAQPMTTLNDEDGRLPADPWFSDENSPPNWSRQSYEITGRDAHASATTNGSKVIAAEIWGPSSILFTCGGGPFGGNELACVGAGEQAEVGVLIGDVNQELARFRSLGKLPGAPFTRVFAGPDGKHLLAQRADGFYALPTTGGAPRKVFGRLPGDGWINVLSWSGSR